ncbi:MAG: rhodanese-like domain-containing protein [Chlorobiales bacterium]|jgi:rhodanese-related sulfurtransferase|nr:rhodanese-like domain-containing protein [Chlorobiales bacterium]
MTVLVRQFIREAGIIFLLSIFLGFVYTGVAGKGFFRDARDTGKSIEETGSGHQRLPQMISLKEADSLFNSGTALFIDARHDFDYQNGHIKGAINLPIKSFEKEPDRVKKLPRDLILVTYCDGASCNSSVELAEKLQKSGFNRIKVFFGGWQVWRDSVLPIEGGKPLQ